MPSDRQMARPANPFLGPIASSAGRPGGKVEDFQHINITDQKKMNNREATVGLDVLYKL